MQSPGSHSFWPAACLRNRQPSMPIQRRDFLPCRRRRRRSPRESRSVWIQSQEDARENARSVHALIHRKTISADTAVQVALLNNRGLQAAYAELGLSAADAWQQTMLENPTVSIGILGVNAPGLGLFRAIEGMIANNLLSLATQKRRVAMADTRFRQAQVTAVTETLSLAHETRRAWIAAVSAFEQVGYLKKAQLSADASSELAKRLGDTGAIPKAAQAREQAFYAELTGQLAEAQLSARLAKEQLTRLMGAVGYGDRVLRPRSATRTSREATDQGPHRGRCSRNSVSTSRLRSSTSRRSPRATA